MDYSKENQNFIFSRIIRGIGYEQAAGEQIVGRCTLILL